MDLDRFTILLDTYGADLDRWPQDERDAATAYIAGSRVARELRAAAARLDDLFARDRATVTDHRREAIIAAALSGIDQRRSVDRRMAWRSLLPLPVAAGFAAVLVAGCLLGLVAVPAAAPPIDVTMLFAGRSGIEGFIQ